MPLYVYLSLYYDDMYWSVEVEAETKSLMLMRNKKFLHEAKNFKNCLPSKTLAKYSVQSVCRAVGSLSERIEVKLLIDVMDNK